MKKYFLLLCFFVFIIFTSGCGVKNTTPLSKENILQNSTLLSEFKSNQNQDESSIVIPNFDMYFNTAYNFIFLYPKDSFVKENGNEIYLTSEDEKNTILTGGSAPTSSYMKITIYDASTSLPLIEGRDFTSLLQKQEKNIIQNVLLQKNHATFEVKNSSLERETIHNYFLRNDGVVVETEYPKPNEQSQKILEEGLSYFSFIDDWVTYKNDAYKFSFRYPVDWSIEIANDIFYIKNLHFPFQLSLSKEEKEIRETEYSSPNIQIGVTPKSFKNTVHAIESSDVYVSGVSQSAIMNIQNIQINNFSGKTGSQSDAVGIGSRVYYLPLSKKNTGIWIQYGSREDGKEKLIEKIISTFRKE